MARSLRLFGVPVRLVGFLGGGPAAFITQCCTSLGIEQRWIPTAGESRTCIVIPDPEVGTSTVINERGPEIAPRELEELHLAIRQSVEPGDLLSISGSAPPGVPERFYATLIEELHARDVRVLIDAGGTVLRLALDMHPWAAAPNEEEAASALAGKLSVEELAVALGRSVSIPLLTRGAQGVLFEDGGSLWSFRPPAVRTVNSVGSGDAFVAGFLAGTAGGRTPRDAIRLGVAWGASNAGRIDQGIGPAEEIAALERQVEITPVPAPPAKGGEPKQR